MYFITFKDNFFLYSPVLVSGLAYMKYIKIENSHFSSAISPLFMGNNIKWNQMYH